MDGKVNPNIRWKVNGCTRLSACDNRPGLKKFYVTVLGADGLPKPDIIVGFDTEPSRGTAYDHRDIWGITDENGYLEWRHFGVPTRYMIWMEDDEAPLIENIRTDLGYEYCRPPGTTLGGWRSVNKPGVYSYRIEIQEVGVDEVPQYHPPVISNIETVVADHDQHEGYASVHVKFETDQEAEAQVYYGLIFKGMEPGGEEQMVLDPHGGWQSAVSEPGLVHDIVLPRATLWYSVESPKHYCFQVVAWPKEYRNIHLACGYSDIFAFGL